MDKASKSETRNKLNKEASVIPAPRKSVKRLMYQTVLAFLAAAFSSSPAKSSDGLHDGSDIYAPLLAAAPDRNKKLIYPTTDL